MTHSRQLFEHMFEVSDDPWSFRTRWYEARKRDLVLGCLPEKRYRNGYEPGCANGELASALAARCDQLLISDGVPAALELAKQRLAEQPNVRLALGWMPQYWPAGSFDLIVLSEVCFYLSVNDLATVAAQAKSTLAPSGTLLACHWRHPVDGFDLDGDRVHGQLNECLALSRLLRHEDRDFIIEVWSDDGRSVAEREGFV